MLARLLSATIAAVLLIITGSVLAEPAVVERDSDLMSDARSDASVVAKLKQGTAVDASARKGPWVSVKTASGSGWLLSFNLRYGTAGASGGGVDAAAIGRIAGPKQKLNITSTIGVRGIEAEDLKAASFNELRLKQLESHRTSDAQARAAAGASGLQATKLKYLN